MKKTYEFLKKCGTYYLATVDGDSPRVRPFGTIDIFEGKLYFQTGKRKPVSHQLEQNQKIEICAFDGEKWIRLSGEAVADERPEASEHMLQSYPELRAMYTPGDGNTIVYYIKNATAVFSSFTAPPETETF